MTHYNPRALKYFWWFLQVRAFLQSTVRSTVKIWAIFSLSYGFCEWFTDLIKKIWTGYHHFPYTWTCDNSIKSWHESSVYVGPYRIWFLFHCFIYCLHPPVCVFLPLTSLADVFIIFREDNCRIPNSLFTLIWNSH